MQSNLFVAAALVAITISPIGARAQLTQEYDGDFRGPLQPLRPSITESEIVWELLAHNELRRATLLGYSVLRTYQVADLKGKVNAQEIGRMEYRSPDKKTFVVTSESGSGLVRHLVLNRLI